VGEIAANNSKKKTMYILLINESVGHKPPSTPTGHYDNDTGKKSTIWNKQQQSSVRAVVVGVLRIVGESDVRQNNAHNTTQHNTTRNLHPKLFPAFMV
jgi:hypothetical protein